MFYLVFGVYKKYSAVHVTKEQSCFCKLITPLVGWTKNISSLPTLSWLMGDCFLPHCIFPPETFFPLTKIVHVATSLYSSSRKDGNSITSDIFYKGQGKKETHTEKKWGKFQISVEDFVLWMLVGIARECQIASIACILDRKKHMEWLSTRPGSTGMFNFPSALLNRQCRRLPSITLPPKKKPPKLLDFLLTRGDLERKMNMHRSR